MTNGWSIYIIALTALMIGGSFWLLLGNRTRPGDSEAKTGHVYDGIEEYDNPLPAWWLYLFVLTLVFAIGYLIAYPGLGSYPGLLGWSQTGQWQAEVDTAKARYEPVFAKYRNMPVEEVAKDPDARHMGQRIFANNCAQCHGSDAGGARGFPSLRDGDWLWGGSAEAIGASISGGRQGGMPPWGQVLGEEGINNAAHYALTLSGSLPAGPESAAGKAAFQSICASCHGAEGKGNPLLGAPNLTDNIWLYGSELETVKHGIRNGRMGKMPAFGGQLEADNIHLLTAYVLSLSDR